jgi:HNH endonuclease
MWHLIKHGYRLLQCRFRDIGIAPKRSSHWKTLEHHFLAEHPSCAACGSKTRLQVHHKQPFHLDPALELDPTNLITLCMSLHHECHLTLGHGGNWKQYVPNVEELAAMVRNGTKTLAEVKTMALAAKIG